MNPEKIEHLKVYAIETGMDIIKYSFLLWFAVKLIVSPYAGGWQI